MMWAHHKRILQTTASAVVLGWVVLCGGCRDKGVEPRPPKDYVVYFAEPRQSGPCTLYSLHPGTRMIDSSEMPWNVQAGLVVSADGGRLYIGDRTTVVVADAKTLSRIAELPFPTRFPVAVSPDNRLVAVTGDDLTILRTSDYSVVFSDTDRCASGCFSRDSKTFFCATSSSGLAYVVNLADSTPTVTRIRFADGAVLQIVPSADQTKWFLYLAFNHDLSVFEVYDVLADSITFRQPLYPGYGRIAVMPNERYLFYTNPGTPGSIISGRLSFTIFDVHQNSVSREIYDTAFFTVDGPYGKYGYPPNDVVVTPDNRRLILWGGETSAKVVYLYDITSDRLVYRQDWGGIPKELTSPSVQTNR